ncbi:MAG: hypothetical protein LBF56_03000 [Holosporales bacterium]|jgi:hypothetical protein|nr:hypothetical protein [Holosporales bacterium]
MTKNKNLILYEKITLLRHKKKFTSTTECLYEEILHTRAAIKQLGIKDGEYLFEIVMQRPPHMVDRALLSAIRWHDEDYVFKSLLKDCGKLYVKGIVGKAAYV